MLRSSCAFQLRLRIEQERNKNEKDHYLIEGGEFDGNIIAGNRDIRMQYYFMEYHIPQPRIYTTFIPTEWRAHLKPQYSLYPVPASDNNTMHPSKQQQKKRLHARQLPNSTSHPKMKVLQHHTLTYTTSSVTPNAIISS